MIHTMNLNNEPFIMIKSKIKTVELRLNDEKRSVIKVDDTIIFTNNVTGEKLTVIVTDIKKYDDFVSLYKDYSPDEIGYKTGEKVDPSDMELYYSKEKIAQYGTLAIRVIVV